MSRRTLARKLAADGLTFDEILDQLRSDLAARYLEERNLAIAQIAWLVGYQRGQLLHPCLQALDRNDAWANQGLSRLT